MRPSCVSTSRPTESMSSRPAGARLRAGGRVESGSRVVVAPRFCGRHQHARRFVAVFGLAADVADRLVEQDRHPLRLLGACPRVDVDARSGPTRWPSTASFAVHTHPAGGDPVVGFAARRDAARVMHFDRRSPSRIGAACRAPVHAGPAPLAVAKPLRVAAADGAAAPGPAQGAVRSGRAGAAQAWARPVAARGAPLPARPAARRVACHAAVASHRGRSSRASRADSVLRAQHVRPAPGPA